MVDKWAGVDMQAMVNRWVGGYLTPLAAGSFVRAVAGSCVTARQE